MATDQHIDGSPANARRSNLALSGRYELLRQVAGHIGGDLILLGKKWSCRYCGCNDRSKFKKVAHAFPEGLGNKWVISLDECDGCNERFSVYDEELVKAVSPFLTLGGVKGKGNKVRQTGRSKGASTIIWSEQVGRPNISVSVKNADFRKALRVGARKQLLELTWPIAGVPFKPRLAYKALTKMAVALLPDDEFDNYQQLRAWLLDAEDAVDFPVLEVAMSFASIGNAPGLVVGSLLRRTDPADGVPHILFLLSAGSVCLQIDLRSDHMEDHLPPVPIGAIKIEWSTVLTDGRGGTPTTLEYGVPTHLNWSGRETVPQPVESMVLHVDPRSGQGFFIPVFRTH